MPSHCSNVVLLRGWLFAIFTDIIVTKLLKSLFLQLYPQVLQHEELVLYLRKVCQVKRSDTAANQFVKFENQLQYQILNMAKSMVSWRNLWSSW